MARRRKADPILDGAIKKHYEPFAVGCGKGSDKISEITDLKVAYGRLVRDEDIGLSGYTDEEICGRTVTLRKRGILGPVLGGHGPSKKKV